MKKLNRSSVLQLLALGAGGFALLYLMPDDDDAGRGRAPKVFAAPRAEGAGAQPSAEEIEQKLGELLAGVATGSVAEERRPDIQRELMALLAQANVGDDPGRARASGLVVQQLFDQSKQQRTTENLSLRQRQAIAAMAKELRRQLLALAVPGGAALGADSIVTELPAGYDRVDWKRIGSFPYHEGAALPVEVTDLNQKNVGVAGFMLTLGDPDDIREFILVESLWGCCFGTVPDVNQSILVRMKGDARVEYTAAPILVTGAFEVGEERQQGFVASLYRVGDARVRTLQ
ncbi:MAG: DUF3299 domain-containing protein [Polyangiaceae bacterium]